MATEVGARQVGELVNLSNRRMIRSARSPLDKCTVVSIFPKAIHEVKFTLSPGKWDIPAGTYDKPATLVVGPAGWWKDFDIEQPMLEIVHSSVQVAESIVRDYCNSMLGCDMNLCMPGLFFVLGEVTSFEIKEKYKEKLNEVKAKQDKWFEVLVKHADGLWARSNNNPLVIADEMRMAALALNLKEKPWLLDAKMIEMKPCKYCGVLRNPIYPVCQACKAIDQDHPLAKEIKFAV